MGEAIKHEHDPWMERLYVLALERMGEEEEALAFIEDYDRRHPDFIGQRNSIKRLRNKRKARQLEEDGRLREAYALWRFLEEDDTSDVIAPVEARRMEDLLETLSEVP